jgi:hypothetical protein
VSLFGKTSCKEGRAYLRQTLGVASVSGQYGTDGQIQKTPIGLPPQPSGGRLKQRVIEKKKAEMMDYMDDVKGLLGMYVPPDPPKCNKPFRPAKFH